MTEHVAYVERLVRHGVPRLLAGILLGSLGLWGVTWALGHGPIAEWIWLIIVAP